MSTSRVLALLPLLVACAPEPVDDDPSPTVRVDAADDPVLSFDALQPHLEVLASIAAEHDGHRAVGSEGYRQSAAYVEDTLTALGLAPWREGVEIVDWSLDEATLTLEGTGLPHAVFDGSASGTVDGTPHPVDLTLPPSSQPNGSTSGCEAEDFADLPDGAIALVQRGTCTFATKAALAEAAGASAVLIFNEGQPGRTDVVEGTLDESSLPGIPVLGLSFADGQTLAESPAPVSLDVRTTVDTLITDNILVDLPGDPDQAWLLGAHLDSVPAGPGINDNGTGVATLLQIAERLAGHTTPDQPTIRLAFWAAEEIGLVGSLWHARQLDEAGVAELLGNLNFDMVGSPNPARFVYDGDASDAPGMPVPDGSGALEALFLDHFDTAGLPTAPIPFEGRTDYVGFAQLGLPVGGLFTGAEGRKSTLQADTFGGVAGEAFDACYHRACDGDDNLDPVVFEQMARAAAAVVDGLLDADAGSAARRALPHGPWQAPDTLPRRVAGGCGGTPHDHAPRHGGVFLGPVR